MDRRTFLEALGLSGIALADAPRALGVLRWPDPVIAEDGTIATQDIGLFGVASDGSVEQWDGYSTPRGILLRWFEPGDVGFPEFGYDLFRARIPTPTPFPLSDKFAKEMAGKKTYSANGVHFEDAAGMTFRSLGPDLHAIILGVGEVLKIQFERPAWYVRTGVRERTPLTARAYAADVLRIEHEFDTDGLTAEWITRGIERIEFTGPGQISSLEYALVTAIEKWTHLVHLCLPVKDPAYPCKPNWTGTDRDEAKGRVPDPVRGDWDRRYGPGFDEMYPILKAIATGQTPPPLPPSDDPAAPALSLDPADAVTLATLDPHVARMLGIAWDDPLEHEGGLNNQAYAYKVTGRWKLQPSTITVASFDAISLQDAGAKIEAPGGSVQFGAAALVVVDANRPARITFPVSVERVSIRLSNLAPIKWRAISPEGNEIASGQFPRSTIPGALHRESINAPGLRQLELLGPARLLITWLQWRTMSWVDRVGLIPGILARELGPPHTPSWVSAAIRQPAGTAGPIEAALDWELDQPSSTVYRHSPTPLYQAAALQASTNPRTPRPTNPAFDRRYLLHDGDFVVVPPAIAAAWPPRELLLDRGTDGLGLKEGWRCWWSRGMDLFGRVSVPSMPFITAIEDNAPPPPPALLLGEYAQAGLAAIQSAPSGQSSFAHEWLESNPTTSGLVISWGWTPELEESCKDVDGFRIFARRPSAVSGGDAFDPTTNFDGVPWGTALAELGPTPIRYGGQVSSVTAGIPAPIAVANAAHLEGTRYACSTDLALQVGAGALVGARLMRGAISYTIVGHGEGKDVTLFVEDNGNAGAPATGTYSIDPGTSDVVYIMTNIAFPSDPSAFKRRVSGALVRGTDRFLVLHASSAGFICRTSGVVGPAVGDSVAWYPAYVFVVANTGQGPQASATVPVAYGQLTAKSVRRWASRPLESPPAVPATITAVDATVPPAPSVPTPAAGDYCAELATRADWYGVSRYTLSWTPDPSLRYVVYRAMGESIMHVDLEEHTRTTPVAAHSFPQSRWLPEIWNDGSRKQLVLNDLSALDTALRAALALPVDDRGRRAGIAAAYAALHSDTQRIIANQPYARAAFVALNGTPLEPSQIPFTDDFDGRARARWFYRIAAKTLAGMEGEWTPPTPPICAPDSVAPTPPQVQLALADVERVRLQWISSPEQDVAKYIVYRAPDELSAADIRTMAAVAAVAPAPSSSPAAGLHSPNQVSGKVGWLEYTVDSTPAGEWFFRLIAEDVSSNRSGSVGVLRARSLPAVPAPPVWTRTQRSTSGGTTKVRLRWSHPTDQRLSCLIERRVEGQPFWKGVSDWLPRGVYEFEDLPRDPAAGAEYRLRVRNTQGLAAAQLPIATLAHE